MWLCPRSRPIWLQQSSDVQWVVESYALFLAALLLTGGALGDIYGRRKIFTFGVVLFSLASAWCGLAPDIRHLIVARALQGIGGALLVPGSLALISVSFPPSERGRAIGTWSGFTSITAAIGPVLGGWLVQHASWRWVFFINLPIALAVLALTLLRVPEGCAQHQGQRLDWPGTAAGDARAGRNGLRVHRIRAACRCFRSGRADRISIRGSALARADDAALALPLAQLLAAQTC